ncbi:helix-turn-helix transcriptional regulator [Bacillus sp. YC2]|uniref:helix-turn-helix domain-containing protein n=1 Tax=Bacillus sp. YC2 TaxID=2861287 RepID=UPI002931E936|nr:helix-turn-helix transcriptional regulator [Bacillus sp. YC2]
MKSRSKHLLLCSRKSNFILKTIFAAAAAGRRLKPLSYLGTHLSRLFVSETGVSYSEFVRHERVKQAASLLKSTDLSIKQIAEEVGLTIHYFMRVFKAKMGSSPGQFRSLYKKANVKV